MIRRPHARHSPCLPAAILLSLACICRHVDAEEGVRRYLSKPDGWFAGDEAARVATTIISHQSEDGGWPKNVDVSSRPYTGDRAKLAATFDNKATVDEIRFLSRMFSATRDPTYRQAFDKGLDYVLAAQYPHGGWPQRFPLRKGYSTHITFNDDAMVRVMRLVREVGGDDAHAFVDDAKKQRCREAFARGLDCILRCQIVVDGRRTVWCAQHDELTFAPAKARAYELPSFSGSESVGIVRLLMSVEEPSRELRDAVEGAVHWLREHAIEGQRLDTEVDGKGRRNRVMVPDADAAPLWARFSDLHTGRPFVCDRDGLPKSNLADIGFERRNGYSWFGPYAATLLKDEYPAWRDRVH